MSPGVLAASSVNWYACGATQPVYQAREPHPTTVAGDRFVIFASWADRHIPAFLVSSSAKFKGAMGASQSAAPAGWKRSAATEASEVARLEYE